MVRGHPGHRAHRGRGCSASSATRWSGRRPRGPLFVTGIMHDLVHLITGALALYIAFGLVGGQQA